MQIEPRIIPSRQPFLERELAQWRGWEIVARCGTEGCQPNPAIPVADVLTARGNGLTLSGLVSHLRCGTCQEQSRDVGLRRRLEGGQVWQLVQGATFW